MTTVVPPHLSVPIGRLNGAPVAIDPSWAFYLTDSLWRRAGGYESVDFSSINAELDDLQDQIDAISAPDLTVIEGRLDNLETDVGILQGQMTGALADIAAAQGDIADLQAAVAAIVAPEVVSVTLDFGASFTDKAQTVVTGQTWVSLSSVITPTVMCPLGIDTDEIRLLDMRPVISDLVAGVGFTVTLYSEPEARGTYTVSCVGV